MANENPPKWLPIWPGSTNCDPGGRGAVDASAVGVNGDMLYWSGVSWQQFSVAQAAAVQALVSATGKTALGHVGEWFPILPTESVSLWNTDLAGVTVSVDTAVLYGGRPTLRIDIPANTSSVVKAGTNGLNALLPYLWDTTHTADAVIATRWSHAAAQAQWTWYIGGAASYAGNNFITFGPATTSPPEMLPVATEWTTHKLDAIGGTAGYRWSDAGSWALTAGNRVQSKVQWTAVSLPYATSLWIGCCGVLPKKKPCVILTLDDGLSSVYDFARPVLMNYGLPCTMALISGNLGTGGYMTRAQVLEMDAHPSALFDFVNHSQTHKDYSVVGAAAMYAEYAACRADLKAIGLTGDGPNHVLYTNNTFGQDLVDLLIADGSFLSARQGIVLNPYDRKTQMLASGDKLRWMIPNVANLQTGTTEANVETQIAAAVAAGGDAVIQGHAFASSAGTSIWAESDWVKLCAYLSAGRAAGTFDVKTWTRWFRDTAGYTLYSHK